MHHDSNLRGEFIGLVQQGDDLAKLPNMVANTSGEKADSSGTHRPRNDKFRNCSVNPEAALYSSASLQAPRFSYASG